MRDLFWRFVHRVRCALEPEPRCGHRITQPGHRVKAIAFWRRCAGVWLAERFADDQIDQWYPAQRSTVMRFGRR